MSDAIPWPAVHAARESLRASLANSEASNALPPKAALQKALAAALPHLAPSAHLAEAVKALRGLLACPDIADNDDLDGETQAAERAARAFLAKHGEKP